MKPQVFKYDEKGKCLNPEVLYTSRGKFKLTYPKPQEFFFEIKMCEKKGVWAIQCIHPYQQNPWGATIYKNRDQAIEAAIYYLRIQANRLRTILPKGNEDRKVVEASLAFLKWLNEFDIPKQLGLF